MGKTNDGKCMFCGETFGKAAIKKHLDKCNARTKEYITEDVAKAEKYFCIFAQGYENPEYWIYIDIPVNTTLKVLDEFLRDIWLECCGHLSAFDINGQTFSCSPDKDYGDKSMSIKLENVLAVGMKFDHEYDFGSTTSLKLKVISEFDGKKRKKEAKLLARNNPPIIKCSYCDQPATNVCCGCVYDEDGWVCDDCIDKHECGEDMMLPVVNSPRVGVCAYEG
ncbi:MAG TPA: hypothetical protein DIC60_04700 [Lachnospiraceae bacterium]|nr:hypothetical protein [Lachnospiraceae bacterium]